MQRPHSDIDVDPDEILRWYFFPYTDYDEYSDDNPLYSLVAVFEDVGDVVIYNRPGSIGTYHTTDPTDTTAEIHPPTTAFKTAVAKIVTNPDDTQDVGDLLSEMHPWESHQLDVLITGLNDQIEAVPIELIAFVNDMIGDVMDVDVSEGPATRTDFMDFMRKTTDHYQELREEEEYPGLNI